MTKTTKPKTPEYKLSTKNKTISLETYSDDCTFERHYSDGTIERGVKIRLVYDSNSKGENIYPNTGMLSELIKNNKTYKNKNTKYMKKYLYFLSLILEILFFIW